jgi:tetratricopeptide (TPR) repeat protein
VIVAAKKQAPPGRARRLCCAVLCIACIGGGAASVAAPPPAPPPTLPAGRIVQFIDTQEFENHADISIEFSCSVRYVNNVPASHGSSTRITLRLGPDCQQFGVIVPELPLVGGGGQLVTGARVDSILPGDIILELTWARALDFVMAPTASGTGLRVRLLNTNRRKGTIFLPEAPTAESYAVNLDAAPNAFTHEQVNAAAAALQTQAYVSEIDIEDAHWYRLRVGPFATRAEAERVLKIAQAKYPRAWLAVNDEQTDLSLVERAGVPSSAVGRPTDPPLPDAERAQILTDARTALEKHQYPEAVDLLNRLLRQPEYPARADAQEMLGLVRERAGQLAQAKAEYEEYLRRYSDAPNAPRVRARLRALVQASIAPQSTGEPAAAKSRWIMAGSAALSYQYGREQTLSAGTTTTTSTLNSAQVYGDLLLRERGQRYDFTARVDAGYTYLPGSISGGSQDRTTAAYVELSDRLFGVTARLGRQSLATLGVVGLFDGLWVGYRINPVWSVSAAAGLPAYSSYSVLSGQDKFGTLTAEFDPFHQTWVFDAYLYDEMTGSATERRAIGLQTRYSAGGRTAVALVDYDIAFRELNAASMIGNARIGQYWVLGLSADHRRSPLLQLSNALIGQDTTDLQVLEDEFTPSQIRQLALARTATSNTAVLSASRSIGERWQFMGDIGAIELTGTPATPAVPGTVVIAVPATQSTGVDKSLTLQLAGSSLLQAGDLHIFSARFDDSPTARSTTLSWDARFVVRGAWRLGPRLSVEELNDTALGGKQWLYLPQVRSDWTNRFSVIEVIAGYSVQNQQALQQQQALAGQPPTSAIEQRSLYVSAAYRVRF